MAAQVLNRYSPNAFKVTAFRTTLHFRWISITGSEGRAIDVEFNWNKPVKQVAEEKAGGKEGLLFLANEAKRLMDPYVPADNLLLAQNVRTYIKPRTGNCTLSVTLRPLSV